MRTEKDIGSENPETTTVSGFFRIIFQGGIQKISFPKNDLGEDLNYIPGLLGADFAIIFAESAPFFVFLIVKCLCLGRLRIHFMRKFK